MTPFNPMLLIALAQKSRFIRWLLGLHNFSLVAAEPGEDPVRKLQTRMITTLTGILAFFLTVLVLGIAGIVTAIVRTSYPAGWILLIGCGGLAVPTGRALLTSRAYRLPTPGVLIIVLAGDILAALWGVMLLTRN